MAAAFFLRVFLLGGAAVFLCDFRERGAGLFARQSDERLRRARETMAGGGVDAEQSRDSCVLQVYEFRV